MPRPPPHAKMDDSDDEDVCDDCMDGNCGQCVDIDEERLKTNCTKCCVGYVVVCTFNVLFIHSLVAGLCIGLIAGALSRDPARLAVVEMLVQPAHGRYAQDILMAAGVLGVLFMLVYVPVRCFGLKSAKCQVAMDLSLMILLISLTASAGFLGIVAKDEEEYLRKPLKEFVMNDYIGDNSNPQDNLWDRTQLRYKCCGASSSIDYYLNSTWWRQQNLTLNVPLSCCRRSNVGKVLSEMVCQSTAHGIQTGRITDTTTPTFVFTKSCTNELVYAYKTYVAQIIALSFSMIILEICGICFAVYIYFIRNRRTVNPADLYRVDEKTGIDNSLFSRRESNALPNGRGTRETSGSSPVAHGTTASSSRGRPTSEPVPGTSTGGATHSKGSPVEANRDLVAEKRVTDMFAAQCPGFMGDHGSGETIGASSSQTVKSDKEVTDMFQIGKGQGHGLFEPRPRPGKAVAGAINLDQSTGDSSQTVRGDKEVIDMFQVQGQVEPSSRPVRSDEGVIGEDSTKGMKRNEKLEPESNGLVRYGSISHKKHEISADDSDTGERKVNAPIGIVNVSSNVQETST